jgi:hypothetical protein
MMYTRQRQAARPEAVTTMTTPTMMRPLSATLALLLCAAGCGDKNEQRPATQDDMAGQDMAADLPVVDPNAPTYQAAIRPLIDQHCVSCHVSGGPAPFSMEHKAEEWAAGPAWWAALTSSSVASGQMPPWMPDESCRSLAASRAMPDADRQTWAAWAAGGYPIGAEADYKPIVAPPALEEDLGPPQLELGIKMPYTPSEATGPDDYRCFILDHRFDKDTFITGTNVAPGTREIVHHVILYAIAPEQVSAIQRLDAEDTEPGYTCFAGPGGSNPRNVGAWVPGSLPARLSNNTAIVIPEGSKIVMQMHYNTLAVPGDAPTPADQTRAQIWTLPEGQLPDFALRVVPFANLDMRIPAGEASSAQIRDYKIPEDSTVVGLAHHMHTLGTSIKAELIREGQDTCLVDIPAWDFNWQQGYRFLPGEELQVKKGDILRQTCIYDNSPANQPIIDGQQQQPRNVRWGESTLDEMCLTYLNMVEPYNPDKKPTCEPNQECLAACSPDDSACTIDCAMSTSGECAQCSFAEFFSCGGPPCAQPGLALRACVAECPLEQLVCLSSFCKAEFDAFNSCAQPLFSDGTCSIAACR